jgi:hypothetical protein
MTYPDVSVIERDSPQGKRENANAINNLLGRMNVTESRLDTVEAILEFQILVGREYAVLNGLASEAINGDIEAWDYGQAVHPDSQITVDPVTGEFTIAIAGLYEITVNLVYAGAGQNVQYGLGTRINTVLGTGFAFNLWTNASLAQSFTGVGVALFAANDVLNLSKTIGNAMTNIDGNMQVKLIDPD